MIKNIKKPDREVQLAAVKADPLAVTFIDEPDVDIMKMAIDTDLDVFNRLSTKNRNRLPKEYIEDMFGSKWEPSKAKGISAFQEI